MNLSKYTSEVVGFDSTWDTDRQVLVKDASTDAMESLIKVTDSSSSTNENIDVEIQTTPVVLSSNSNEETDKKLASWLKKILPALEKELNSGLTPVSSERNEKAKLSEKPLKIELYQEIDVKHLFSSLKNETPKGAATWLSVFTQDSPVLAVSCSFESDEQQQTSFIVIYEPRRSKSDANIYWNELLSIPVKDPIEFLVCNHHNRDMFAGATKTCDLYIWLYHNMPSNENESQITELFSKVSEDSIEALSFLSDNRLLCCHSDGKLIVYKINSKHTATVDKLMKIEPKNVKDPEITCVTSFEEAENAFVLGLLNGSLLYCSTNQLLSQSLNPIVRELQAHKFAISSLNHCHHNGVSYIVSCDISGEVFIHKIDDNLDQQPKLVMKLPLKMPLKNKITCKNNMEHIICLDKGTVEIFKTSSKEREHVTEGNEECYRGNEILELSRNESWLISGIYNGSFKIYHLINHE